MNEDQRLVQEEQTKWEEIDCDECGGTGIDEDADDSLEVVELLSGIRRECMPCDGTGKVKIEKSPTPSEVAEDLREQNQC